MKKITIKEFIEENKKKLAISIFSGEDDLDREVATSKLNRLGLSLAGHFKYFPSERIQICGPIEHSYLGSLTHAKRIELLNELFSTFPNIPCIVITRSLSPWPELLETSSKYQIPLIGTSLGTSKFIMGATDFLEERLSPSLTMHGVLVDIYGLGVMILGESGIGKSECALELLKRGHMLIADDVVEIILKPGEVLVGRGKSLTNQYIEARGLGILNISSLFGVGVLLEKTRVELVIKLEEWGGEKEIERLESFEEKINILGVELPMITIPVKPGRNLAILMEVAALNYRLKRKGVSKTKEMEESLKRLMEK